MGSAIVSFFFQAEDGIRDYDVTGVQTCALPILGLVRAQLEAASEKRLAALVAETARRQAALEARFPEAFETVDAAVEKRQATRKSLNDDPEFQARNRAVVDAGKAVKDYEGKAAPNLARLAADAKAHIDSLGSPKEK